MISKHNRCQGFIGTTYADWGNGTALVWNRNKKLFEIWLNCQEIVVDADKNLVLNEFRDSITQVLLLTHTPETNDKIVVKTTNRIGIIHKKLPNAHLYVIRFSDVMCRDIVNWHDNLHVFVNPADSVILPTSGFIVTQSSSVDAMVQMYMMDFASDPKMFLHKHPAWVLTR
jgi:hypothetical protein